MHGTQINVYAEEVRLLLVHTSSLQSHESYANTLLSASLIGNQSSKQLYVLRASRVLGYPHLGKVSYLSLNMRGVIQCANGHVKSVSSRKYIKLRSVLK